MSRPESSSVSLRSRQRSTSRQLPRRRIQPKNSVLGVARHDRVRHPTVARLHPVGVLGPQHERRLEDGISVGDGPPVLGKLEHGRVVVHVRDGHADGQRRLSVAAVAGDEREVVLASDLVVEARREPAVADEQLARHVVHAELVGSETLKNR